MLLWALWITWHLPIHFSGHWNADTLSFQVALVSTFLARFLFTWLYLRTEGGLWSALLFHSSANVAYAVIPATWAAKAIGSHGFNSHQASIKATPGLAPCGSAQPSETPFDAAQGRGERTSACQESWHPWRGSGGQVSPPRSNS
jgi:hypothetical protein